MVWGETDNNGATVKWQLDGTMWGLKGEEEKEGERVVFRGYLSVSLIDLRGCCSLMMMVRNGGVGVEWCGALVGFGCLARLTYSALMAVSLFGR